MLYQIYDFQKALLQPLTSWAKTTSETFINPANPLSLLPGAERFAASYELLHRLGKDYKKPEFGIRSIKAHGKEVVVQELTALAKPFCNLVQNLGLWKLPLKKKRNLEITIKVKSPLP